MGTFTTDVKVNGVRISGFLVDTGALYSAVPQEKACALGMIASRHRTLRLADGTVKTFPMTEARLSILKYSSDEVTCPVVITPEGSPCLLGATALETLAFAADAANKTLIPVIAPFA